nr:zinc finger, CCHC-type [Tanacetum cinerariifolium]
MSNFVVIMAGNTVKEMTANFEKLNKFEGHDFRRWQKKMLFLLTTLKENDDCICRGHILNGMFYSLFDVYTNVESAKELWDSLESKYTAEDSSSKKFLVSNFNNYNMVDSRPVMEQYNELFRILGQYTQHGLKMDESISVSSIIDKLPPSWKDFKHTLKREVGGLSVNLTKEGGKNKHRKQNKGKKRSNDNNSGSRSNKKPKLECWKCGKTGHFKRDCRSDKKNNVNSGGSGKGSKDQSHDQGQNLVPIWNRFIKYSISLISEAFYVQVDAIAWWIDSGVITHVCKDRCWFKTYEPVEDGAVVRLPGPKRKTLGKKGIDGIFVGYAEHSKAYRFYIIEPNDSVSINSIIESKDAIFDENRFSSIPRPKDIILNSDESQRDHLSDDVPNEIPEPRKGKKVRKAKSYGSDSQLYLVEGSRDQKEKIDDEIGSIMKNNTWVLSDLPPSCKPLGCKWIFKKMIKVDGTVDKFKARLVIQGFRQKKGIDYFDTYAPVARITTIRLLLALAAIHNLVIHQMDVKTTFLNGDLDEEVYIKQPKGFVMPGNKHKVCKLVKSLYGLKQAPKQWHQKFDDVVLSSGFLLNQSDKCVYSKFDDSGKGVILCLYVDDMLIFGTDQNQVDKTKKFLSLRFSMKDMGEADVILGTKIKRENKGIVITQSHYIEKILKKFNRKDCSPAYSDASWINHVEDSSSTNGWVFPLGGGAISWASKKQTCITGSTMESEFVALAAAGKEAEWLRNLIYKIPIWPKPIAPISIRCDSALTMARTYSQIYNGKSRHLGVRHSMIRELIRNGVISIKFVPTQHNLADHLTKGLARDLVNKLKKAQEKDKIGSKREAWRSREKSKGVTVDRARKTEENKKRMNENAYTVGRPKDIIPNVQKSQMDVHIDDVPNEIHEPRKTIDDEIGSIMENNTWVLSDLPPGCKPLGCKWIFKIKMKVDETIDKFKARLVIQGFRQKEWIDYFDTYALVARITTIRLLLALAAIHNLVIHQMNVKAAFLNGDLDEEVYMKQPEGFVMPGNEHKVSSAAAGKEAEWLRNLVHEIPIWPKPIAPISIRCDSAPTMARAYSPIYNGKSRHLGVRHSMVRELIRNGVISIEFVWMQHNLADHLMKGLARDWVNKSVKGM